MTKILRVSDKRRALELLYHTGLFYAILPEIAVMRGCEQPPEFHPEGDVFEHTVLALSELPKDASDTLLWGTLLHDIGKPPTQTFVDRIRFSGHDKKGMYMTEEILKKFKFSNDFIDQVKALVENHMKFMCVEEMRTSTLKRFMNLNKFDEHLELHRVDCLSSHGDLEHYDFMVEKLKSFEATPEKVMLNKLPRLVTGHDLIAMGYPQGTLFRTILTDIEDQQLEDAVVTREQALAYITKKYLI
jgi:poly(A) polymerase